MSMMQQHAARPAAHPRHLGWASRAVVSGFLASVAALLVLLAAYAFAYAVGSTSPNANIFSRSMWNLAHNPVTSLVATVHLVQAVGLHLAVGVIWAVIYAAVVEPNIAGRGWVKGLVFAVVPCLISLFIFMPIVGAGVLGMSVDAGPFPALGSVLLHAIYGIVLGETYALTEGEGVSGGIDSPIARILTLIERDLALGLVIGAVLGALVGLVLSATGLGWGGSQGPVLTIVGGATEGGFVGVVCGIFIGLITSQPMRSS